MISVWKKAVLSQVRSSPVSWSCIILQLHLCRGVRQPPHQQMSWIWHKTIWWQGSSNGGALGNVGYPFIAIAPRFTLAQIGNIWQCLIYGSSRTVWHLNCVQTNDLRLNWIVRNRTMWSFNYVYLQNVFTNPLSDIYM